MSKNYINDSQTSEIVKYISDTMKLPIMGAGGGFAPIGTINSYMGTVAPIGWLVCDGTVYNISDYPDLATHIASQFGSTNFFGGNGTTTFGVPDLRGEFLRGSGTNSHENQGSGANVGVHQDGSLVNTVRDSVSRLAESTYGTGNPNYDYVNGSKARLLVGSSATDNSGSVATTRPTNTSVLFIIKATVSGDANAHQYSTEEQVVGKWIDGRDVYERTLFGNSLSTGETSLCTIDNLDIVIDTTFTITTFGGESFSTSLDTPSYRLGLKRASNNSILSMIGTSWTGTDAVASYVGIVKYTKTQ